MARRTVDLPDDIEALARQQASEGGSFSATVARLIELGADATRRRGRPSNVGAGVGPDDLRRLAQQYVRNPVPAR